MRGINVRNLWEESIGGRHRGGIWRDPGDIWRHMGGIPGGTHGAPKRLHKKQAPTGECD